MVIHKCDLCNFSSKQKNDLFRHLKTKKHLYNEKNYEEENKKNLEKGLKKDLKGLFPAKKGLKKDFLLHNDYDLFVCQYCSKSLKTRPIMLRHIRKTCKEKNANSEKKELKEFIKSQTKQISKLLEKNNIQNNTHNTQNNTQNTTINNIHINNYGEENLEMLTDEFKEKCVTKPFYALIEIIKKIHFNDDYPENKNMRLLNKKDNKIQVLDDGKWKYRYKEEAVKYALYDSNDP
jgi:hypothetical protein